MQYYYQCHDKADADASSENGLKDNDDCAAPDEMEISELVNGIEVKKVLSGCKEKEIQHANKMVAIGAKVSLFGNLLENAWVVAGGSITIAGESDMKQVGKWTNTLQEAAAKVHSNGTGDPLDEHHSPGNMGDINPMDTNQNRHESNASITYKGDETAIPPAKVDISMLSVDQLQAFNVIKTRFRHSKLGERVDQLLMQIQGESGAGKSMVILKVTELFKLHGWEMLLHKSTYTGIAASLIGGSTLHQLSLLHKMSKMLRKTMDAPKKNWDPVTYLIIDEVSMISKKTLANISEMVGIGIQQEGNNNSTVPF
jgi:hypothetical protein